ncbi:MAG TPA: hypothetical protein ENI78_02915 [Euryarchaeota archaeon]|nr:hypothetical protein [Euryarchaeota archaeon]
MPLKLLLDENIPISVFKFLKERRYEAFYVPQGAKDRDVAELAKRDKAVLLTRDYDFANILLYPPQDFHGNNPEGSPSSCGEADKLSEKWLLSNSFSG